MTIDSALKKHDAQPQMYGVTIFSWGGIVHRIMEVVGENIKNIK